MTRTRTIALALAGITAGAALALPATPALASGPIPACQYDVSGGKLWVANTWPGAAVGTMHAIVVPTGRHIWGYMEKDTTLSVRVYRAGLTTRDFVVTVDHKACETT